MAEEKGVDVEEVRILSDDELHKALEKIGMPMLDLSFFALENNLITQTRVGPTILKSIDILREALRRRDVENTLQAIDWRVLTPIEYCTYISFVVVFQFILFHKR